MLNKGTIGLALARLYTMPTTDDKQFVPSVQTLMNRAEHDLQRSNIPSGAKRFEYGQHIVYALNKTNADKKARKFGYIS